jgi:hypothetical protein
VPFVYDPRHPDAGRSGYWYAPSPDPLLAPLEALRPPPESSPLDAHPAMRPAPPPDPALEDTVAIAARLASDLDAVGRQVDGLRIGLRRLVDEAIARLNALSA